MSFSEKAYEYADNPKLKERDERIEELEEEAARWRSLADRLGEALDDSSYHNHPILDEWRRAKGEAR